MASSLRAVLPRHGFAALAIALLVALIMPGGLVAHAETDLEKAEREAAEAEASRNAAAANFDISRDTASSLQLQLLLTLEEYQTINREVETLGLRIATVRSEMDLARGEIIALDKEVEVRAVDAYIRGISNPTVPFFMSESFASASVADEAIKRATDQDTLAIQHLDDRRADLLDFTIELEQISSQLVVKNDALALRTAELDELFALADRRVAAAFRNLDAADAAYEQAQATLEEEQRKNIWLGGVQQWRPLVETYFPPERVEEAMRVMACESGGNPAAKNPNSTATGLFQFLDGTWAWMSVMSGWDGHSRLEPEANVAVAAYLVDYSIRTNHPLGTWGHWECQP